MHYNRIALSFIGASVLSTSAMAAPDWTGWYVGANAGYNDASSANTLTIGGGWLNQTPAAQNFLTNLGDSSVDLSGASLGLHGGYRYEFASGWTIGAEAEFGNFWLSEIDDSQFGVAPDNTASAYAVAHELELKQQFAFRPMVGYAFDRGLLYFTAGAASIDFKATSVVANGTIIGEIVVDEYIKGGSIEDRFDAYQAGIGFEFESGTQWALRVEYMATFADDVTYAGNTYEVNSIRPTPEYTETYKRDIDVSAIRVGFTYRF